MRQPKEIWIDTKKRPIFVPPTSDNCIYYADHPITIDEFFELFDEDANVELVDGVVMSKMAASDPHESLFAWLLRLLGNYVEAKGLGEVRGSRTLVPVTLYKGRLPDILFVHKGRRRIIQHKGLTAAPDFIIEIISPGDRPAEIIGKQAEYEQIGVKEFWQVDLRKKQVTVFRLNSKGRFVGKTIESGVVRSRAVEGFWVEVEWLFPKRGGRPPVLSILQELLGQRSSTNRVRRARSKRRG